MITNNSGWDLYYYGLPGDEHDETLYSTKFPNTRVMFLIRSFMSMIENSKTYLTVDINGVMGSSDTDQIMKLIDICRFQHDW